MIRAPIFTYSTSFSLTSGRFGGLFCKPVYQHHNVPGHLFPKKSALLFAWFFCPTHHRPSKRSGTPSCSNTFPPWPGPAWGSELLVQEWFRIDTWYRCTMHIEIECIKAYFSFRILCQISVHKIDFENFEIFLKNCFCSAQDSVDADFPTHLSQMFRRKEGLGQGSPPPRMIGFEFQANYTGPEDKGLSAAPPAAPVFGCWLLGVFFILTERSTATKTFLQETARWAISDFCPCLQKQPRHNTLCDHNPRTLPTHPVFEESEHPSPFWCPNMQFSPTQTRTTQTYDLGPPKIAPPPRIQTPSCLFFLKRELRCVSKKTSGHQKSEGGSKPTSGSANCIFCFLLRDGWGPGGRRVSDMGGLGLQHSTRCAAWGCQEFTPSHTVSKVSW